ncbi:MAG: penicillin-binding protein 1B [Gammaproteobacteria bacterium]|nr:penicillin-binding protein 1B [Gammaproteobacteria bacterium]
MPPQKKTKRKSKAKPRSSHRQKQPNKLNRKSIWVIAGIAAGVLFVSALLYVVYLDAVIRIKFEGKRWSLPARVYARPMEIYPGESLTKEDLLAELKFLNYRPGSKTPGTYSERGNSVLLNTRGFTFWDKQDQARRVNITFSVNQVLEILDIDSGGSLLLQRLEPAQIASIYPTHKEDRDLIRLQDAPDLLVQSLLAVEDQDFYEHAGIKPTSILRALVANIRAGGAVQGGSTLTQQLVKNFFLTNERTLSRKANEAIMALLLEWHYEKDEILEAYLNEVFLGQQGERAIHGFALASRFYFDRPLNELNTDEIALLVGLVKGASYYNPRRQPERALERRNLIIDVMLARDLLDSESARRARLAPLSIRPEGDYSSYSYPAFIDLVKRQLNEIYRDEDLRSEGLRIFTTFDPLIQQSAEQALSTHLARLETQRKLKGDPLQGAVVVTSTDSGEILALVGDRDPRFSGYNRALDAKRPIGSLVKPAVYMTALQQPTLYHAATLIDDTSLEIEFPPGKVWAPTNYSKEFHGSIPLAQGLINSYNVATARLGLQVGVDRVVANLQKMGLQESPPPYPSLLLGALELPPIEVAQMYQTLAAGGFRTPLRALREVLTAEGSGLNRYPLKVEQTLDQSSVYLINNLLQLVVKQGTAKAVGRHFPYLNAAGKTGTSDELRDSWFAGFTGSHLAVVWVGRDNNTSTGLSGASAAVPVWIALMDHVHSRELRMSLPANIEHVWIDWQTGQRSAAKCDNTVQLPFIIGSAPEQKAECHRQSWIERLFNK